MIFNMTFQHQLAKIESVKVWVTRLPSRSHSPLSVQRHRVTCLPPKNVSAPWGGTGSRWLTIIIWQFNDIQYLLACQKSQWTTPYNIVKSGLPWKPGFPPSPSWEAGDCSHLPPMAHREFDVCPSSVQKVAYFKASPFSKHFLVIDNTPEITLQ